VLPIECSFSFEAGPVPLAAMQYYHKGTDELGEWLQLGGNLATTGVQPTNHRRDLVGGLQSNPLAVRPLFSLLLRAAPFEMLCV
jgi:hypothetical protein